MKAKPTPLTFCLWTAAVVVWFLTVLRTYGGEADTLPRAAYEVRPADAPPSRPARHPIYDHPRAQMHLRQAAATGQKVIEKATEDGTGRLMEYTFHPDGRVTSKPAQAAQEVVYQPAQVAYQTVPRQEVAVAPPAQTFQRGGRIPGTPYVEGHRCPACGHESPPDSGTWVIRGGDPRGVHVHSCPRCGQSWRHRG